MLPTYMGACYRLPTTHTLFVVVPHQYLTSCSRLHASEECLQGGRVGSSQPVWMRDADAHTEESNECSGQSAAPALHTRSHPHQGPRTTTLVEVRSTPRSLFRASTKGNVQQLAWTSLDTLRAGSPSERANKVSGSAPSALHTPIHSSAYFDGARRGDESARAERAGRRRRPGSWFSPKPRRWRHHCCCCSRRVHPAHPGNFTISPNVTDPTAALTARGILQPICSHCVLRE